MKAGCRAALLLLAALALPAEAASTPPAPAQIGLRGGVHPGFGRLVVSPPVKQAYSLTRENDRLHLRMAGSFGRLAAPPPNLRGVAPEPGGIGIALAPGAAVRAWPLGPRLVLDIYAAGETPPPPGQGGKLLPVPLPPPAAAPAPKPPQPAQAPPPPAAPVPAPNTVAVPDALPPPPVSAGGLIAGRLADGVVLPFATDTGAAAFRRGDRALLVFDEAKPLDLAALHGDPVFGGAQITLLPAATLMTLPLPAGQTLSLSRRAEGWAVRLAAAPVAASLQPEGADGTVRLATPAPGTALVIEDPDTGGKLLVGTSRREGAALRLPYRSPEFSLLPSWLGVVVEPRSDRLALLARREGFTLAADSGPKLAASLGTGAAAAVERGGELSRSLDFPPLPTAWLRERLRERLAAAAAAPRLERFAPRLRAAEAMLALGLGPEAAGLLRVAAADEPEQAQDPRLRKLTAIAAWLAGQVPGPAGPPGDDEAALWQALGTPGQGNGIAANWRLVLGYPETLRRVLMPPMAAALAAAGQGPALDALLAASGEPLALARARRLRDRGHTQEALAAFDRIAAGTDRRDATLALRDAVELRLRAGTLDAAGAAAMLDRHLYDWRGDGIELDQRLLLASLRAQAGQFRPALALLRETETLFPDAKNAVRDAGRAVVAALLRPQAASALPPLELVALAEESADLLTEQESGEKLAPALAAKLMALDLPDRAAPILERMLGSAKTPALRAELGLQLAGLRLERGDPAGARSALSESEAAGIDPMLDEKRRVMSARASAASGDVAGALAALGPAASEDALGLQAEFRGEQHDWRGQEQALQELARTRLAGAGRLDGPQQDLLLRLASAASNAQDMAALRSLQAEQGSRMPPGPRADLFRVLTGSPVRAVADLGRSAGDLAAARAALAGFASR